MNKNKIINKIEILKKKIKKWNYLYYFKNEPIVSDQVYDSHYKELCELEKKYPDLMTEDSPTKTVGYLNSKTFSKIKHEVPMFSLSNAFSKKDLIDFDQRIKKITEGKNKYFCEYKIDGLSVSLIFKNFKFFSASTRGDGKIGENITKNIFEIKSISKLLKQTFKFKNFELRGEVFINKKEFFNLNKDIFEKQKEELKNLIIKKHNKEKNIVVFFKKNFNIEENILYLMETNFEEELDSFEKNKIFIFDVFCSKKKIIYLIEEYKKINIEIIDIFENKLKVKIKHIFSKNKFVNPRNAASGSLRQLDVKVTKERKLSVLFYYLNQKEIEINTQKKVIEEIQNLGFPIELDSKICLNIEEVFNFIDNKKEKEFEVDGIVIKTNEKKYYKEIGKTSKYFNHSIAYKFPEKIIETKLLDIFPTVGRTGKIIYNAKLQQVFLDGTIVRAAILHNKEYIKKLDIRINDVVKVKKAGNIIPKIMGFNKLFRKKNYIKWEEIKYCFSCKTKLIIFDEKIDQYCLNENCEEKMIQVLIHFVSRNVMNISGISEKIIRSFWKLNILKTQIDFYKLKNKKEYLLNLIKTKKLINWGEKSIDNLLDSIEVSKLNKWDKLLFGLNIKYVGKNVSKILTNYFKTIDKLIIAKKEELEKIKGIGPSVINSIFSFFLIKKNVEIIEEFKNLGLNFNEIISEEKKGFFKNKKIAITGIFNISRKVIVNKLEEQGAIFVGSVSSLTDYLFVGKNPGNKINKIKKTKTKILNEEEILEMLK